MGRASRLKAERRAGRRCRRCRRALDPRRHEWCAACVQASRAAGRPVDVYAGTDWPAYRARVEAFLGEGGPSPAPPGGRATVES